MAFVELCEGYLGVKPNFVLWRYFFGVSLQRGPGGAPTPMGCAGNLLRSTLSGDYIPIWLSSSNKGWHRQWFYLKNDADAALPDYTRKTFDGRSESWHWGVTKKEGGLLGGAIIEECHWQRVLPLMARALPLHAMGPSQPWVGTAMSDELPTREEVVDRLREALSSAEAVFPVPDCPQMRPRAGFMTFVSLRPTRPFLFSLVFWVPFLPLTPFCFPFFASPSKPQAFTSPGA